MTQEKLMEVFKFDQQDLAENRQGRLSKQQQARWLEAGQWSQAVIQTAVPLGGALLFAIVGIVISLGSVRPQVGIFFSVLTALFVGGMIRIVVAQRPLTVPQDIPSVGHVKGIAHLKETLDEAEGHLSRRYRVEVEHHTFQLFTKHQFEALKNGGHYAVYFMDDADKFIVSLERLSDKGE